MSFPANNTIKALDSVSNSTNVAGLLESLIGLVQNITNFLPTLLAQSQENNRALAHLCDFTETKHGTNYCATGSNIMVPSMLGMGVAVMLAVLVNMVDHFV
ncbi:MAG: hypothetical protein Q9175_000511 [Cornicularia normoerica]